MTQCRVEAAVSSANNCLGLTSSSPAGRFFVATRGSEGVLVFDADSGREESAVKIPGAAAGNSDLLSTDPSVLVMPRSGKRRPAAAGAVVLHFG